MLTLAIDTASAAASVALLREGTLLAEYTLVSGNTHSVTLLPMIENMLGNLGLKPSDIDLYAVSAGPGSFTGVRIGVCAAKGLAFADDKPCVAVSSLEAMAEALGASEGIICPVMNARRNNVYTALFKGEKGTVTRLTEDALLSVDELEAQLARCGGGVWFTGDGYSLVCRMTDNLTPERLRYQSAAAVGAVGERIYASAPDKSIFSSDALKPVYLRKPQAQRELEEKQKNGGMI